MNKERLIAFTDAIAAIAATIMVLELGVPITNDWAGFWAERNILFAYIVSYMMIYLVWYMHHNLFQKAEFVSTRTFLINGVWLFFLTLVPFTTAWVGNAPEASVPRFVYTLNMLLWALCFQWMDYQIRKDNPGCERDSSNRFADRAIMYGGFALCLILSFVYTQGVIPLIGVISVAMIIRVLVAARKRKTSKNSPESLKDGKEDSPAS